MRHDDAGLVLRIVTTQYNEANVKQTHEANMKQT